VVELRPWNTLTDSERLGATEIGFDQGSWDCYQNHYKGYSWSELAAAEVQEYWAVFVGRKRVFTGRQTMWDKLTARERGAAEDLCFLNYTWDNDRVSLTNLPMWQVAGATTMPSASPSSIQTSLNRNTTDTMTLSASPSSQQSSPSNMSDTATRLTFPSEQPSPSMIPGEMGQSFEPTFTRLLYRRPSPPIPMNQRQNKILLPSPSPRTGESTSSAWALLRFCSSRTSGGCGVGMNKEIDPSALH